MPHQPNPVGLHKGMRKGTHSCYECRKRKIRCIFAKDSTICESCAARDKECTQQRRELLQATAVDNRESLRDRVARLEAIIASGSGGGSVTVDQTSNNLEVDSQDTQPDEITPMSSSLSIDGNIAPASTSSLNAFDSVNKDSSQNIDPIVTLFNNAIVRFIVPLNIQLLRTHIVETK